MSSYTFSSESVSEGHPDKVCDYIADSILDAHLAGRPQQPRRVRGALQERTGRARRRDHVSHRRGLRGDVARQAIREIGYTDATEAFNADGVKVIQFISKQSGDIAMGVDTGGAGDQGIMFGYATDETPELMPLPVQLAHRLSQRLATARKAGERMWLRPDSKTQVSVRYENNEPVRVETVLVSTQHTADASHDEIRDYVASCLAPEVLGAWFGPHVEILVNPTGQFIEGGPSADCGVTGRKIIVDTYGGMGRHGGGAFSGKDPSKVDRSGAYFGRYVARQVVKTGLRQARRGAGCVRDRTRRAGVGARGYVRHR